VPELIAKTALAGQVALERAGTVLAEVDLGQVWSVAPFPGQEKAVAKALKPLGLAFPAVNSFVVKGEARIVWTGRAQAFLIGTEVPEMGAVAAVTDQSGGWACLSLSGRNAAAALMRYVPMDLRVAAFPVGMAARTPLYHMQMILMCVGAEAFEIMVFRSMARTAWHEIEVALTSLAAREKLG
jgi:heterotetrameric sarcosine oxidase gamma subunit